MKKIFFVSLVFSAGISFSQTNQLIFSKGQRLELTTQMTSATSMELMGQAMQSSATTSVSEIFDVKDTANTGATIEHSVKRIQFDVTGGMGQNFSFDSDKEEDRKGDIGKSLDKTLKDKYQMTVDKKGIVTGAKADENNPKSTGANDGMIGMMLSQLNVNAEMPKVGDAIVFKILPGDKIDKGYSWTDSLSTASGTKKTIYTVSDITDNEIAIDFTEESTVKTTQQIMGVDATINSKSAATGKIILDKQTGLLKQKTTNIDAHETIETQGQSMPSTSKRTITVTVKPV